MVLQHLQGRSSLTLNVKSNQNYDHQDNIDVIQLVKQMPGFVLNLQLVLVFMRWTWRSRLSLGNLQTSAVWASSRFTSPCFSPSWLAQLYRQLSLTFIAVLIAITHCNIIYIYWDLIEINDLISSVFHLSWACTTLWPISKMGSLCLLPILIYDLYIGPIWVWEGLGPHV